jgi:FtsP/CotA-like multicopper oxidase with cupredoxin domain
MVHIDHMARPLSLPDRRDMLAGLSAMVLGTLAFRPVAAQAPQALALRAKVGEIALGPGPVHRSWVPVWVLEGPKPVLRYKRGSLLDIALHNELPPPVALCIRGIDGTATNEPLTTTPPLTTGTRANLSVPLRHSGTCLCELWLAGEGATQPTRPLPLIVEETEPVPVDRDEVLLIEEWRLRADGTPIAPGTDPKDVEVLHTINGEFSSDMLGIPVRANERLRFRFINASHSSIVAVKLETLDLRVMALDGQPAEPFPARNGALVLPPGTRADAFIDVSGPAGTRFSMLLHDGKQARVITQLVISNEPPIRSTPLPPAPPLPSNGLPAQLDLRNAQRFDIILGGAQTDWVSPASFAAAAAPAFQARAGRTVVLALTNRSNVATTFHLHGHHFRLLDRLDDGWKPFWLDTLAVEPGQTQRIAFLAEYAGRWLIESVATDWSAPRLVRWYGVA